jgi:hypothetical protein
MTFCLRRACAWRSCARADRREGDRAVRGEFRISDAADQRLPVAGEPTRIAEFASARMGVGASSRVFATLDGRAALPGLSAEATPQSIVAVTQNHKIAMPAIQRSGRGSLVMLDLM